MLENNLFERSSVKKLDLFLNYSCKGFALLTVNERYIIKDIEKYICTKKRAKVYDLAHIEYIDILADLNNHHEIEVAIFSNFYMDINRSHSILEKFNIGRDLLLSRIPYCFFIVPLHLELFIQESLPNLFSYFLIKERFVRKFQNYFSYILPEDMYLKTKNMQKNLKVNVDNVKDDILQRLDGYLHIKVSKEDFKELKRDTILYLKNINKTQTEYDRLYSCKLRISLARVAIVQGEFDEALQIYSELANYNITVLSNSLWWEIGNGIGDTFLYMKEYKKAYNVYSNMLVEICSNDVIEESVMTDYKIRLYSKTALCQMRLGKYDSTKLFIKQTLQHINTAGKDAKGKYFHVYYNYFLMYIEMFAERTLESDKMLKELEEYPKDDVQNAMFLTIKAWYNGIIEGNLHNAIIIAHDALVTKRRIYIENDSRIAESHYVNALLRLFAGRYTEALNCAIKSQNILKNFEMYTDQKKQSKELIDEIINCLHNRINYFEND